MLPIEFSAVFALFRCSVMLVRSGKEKKKMIDRIEKNGKSEEPSNGLIFELRSYYTYVSFKVHDKKFHKETVIVSGMKTVPKGEEEQRHYLAAHP